MRFQVLPGFRDFFPEDLAIRRWIESAWHSASRAAGFQEFDGPVLEALELFTAKSGDEISGQLYTFVDKGDRAVALRCSHLGFASSDEAIAAVARELEPA